MPVTISADGLSIIHQGSGGVANASSPDVCKTTVGNATVPLPYGNTAKAEDLAQGSTTVTADGGNPIAIQGSIFSKSTGDADGDKKGNSSGTIEDKAEFTSWSDTVLIEGKGVCRLSDTMNMNNGNATCDGVQNPSVTVTEDDIGTFTVDVSARYPNGKPYANADFELVTPAGEILGSGTLDASGEAEVPDLKPSACNLILKETTDAYVPNQRLPENHPTETYQDPNDFCVYVAGHVSNTNAPFWEKRVGVASTWGYLMSSQLTDDDFKAMVYEQSRLSAPYAVSKPHSHDFASAFVAALHHIAVEEDKDTLEKYTDLLELSLEQAHPHGDILRTLYDIHPSDEPKDILGRLRYFGVGNTLDYMTQMDWAQVNTQLCQFLDALSQALDGRLTWIQHQADLKKYSAVVDGIQAYRDGLKGLGQSLPDIFKKIGLNVQDNLSMAADIAKDAEVNATMQEGFSTVTNVIDAVVYTVDQPLDPHPFVRFYDASSE